ncbi:MAG: 4Fe-4S binding protein [candidate division NC10 bacterium]|nr:4Fe-4S binding protein [candidate division NC10 bacterium]
MVLYLCILDAQGGSHREHTVYEDIPHYNRKTKKKRRPRLMAVVNDSCTGCEACIPFCPVDCIDHEPSGTYTGAVIPPVRIRWHECIGCLICARVCDGMAWEAIDMIPIDDFEDQFRVPIGDQAHPPEEAPQEAVTAGTAD